MGNDQSSLNEKREREFRTQAAIERALENQRLLYEKRCRELLSQTQQQSTCSTSVCEVTAEASGTNTINRQNLYPNLSQVTAVPPSPTVINHSPPDSIRNVLHANVPSCSTNTQSEFRNDGVSRVTPSAPPASPESSTDRQPKRNRPKSKQKITGGGPDLNCSTCNNKFGLNIFQCSNGHSSCLDCRKNGRSCGIPNCGKTITDMRNRTVEAYVADILLAQQVTQHITGNQKQQSSTSDHWINCPNKQDGCGLRFTTVAMKNHLKECPFNEMACPLTAVFGRCVWKGKINHLHSHFADLHPEHLQANVDTEMTLANIENDKRIVHLVVIGTYNFLVHLKVDASERMIFMGIQLIGTNMSAVKWNYEFHIYNKAQPRRKYQYLDICQSNIMTIDDIFKSHKCLVIPFEYAMSYKNNDSITFKFFIKKQLDGNKKVNKAQQVKPAIA